MYILLNGFLEIYASLKTMITMILCVRECLRLKKVNNFHAQVLIKFFSFLLYVHIQDKSTTDDQRSWDGFKTMIPEQMCGSNEHKDILELRSKPWDTSPANTPDTSEGDFQTEVWREHTPKTNLETTKPSYVLTRSVIFSKTCSKGFCTLQVWGQTSDEECSILYFHTETWNERVGPIEYGKTFLTNCFLSWFYSRKDSLSPVWWFGNLK